MRGWGGARRGRGCAGALEGEAPLHPSAPKSGAGAPRLWARAEAPFRVTPRNLLASCLPGHNFPGETPRGAHAI